MTPKKSTIKLDNNVSYADSKCADAQGMNEAINMYMHNMVDVFFGPNCDYSVAPVARQVTLIFYDN
jgi:hypothetical protein